jgi:hypothetical protein
MFKVTLPFDGTPRTEDGKVNKEDFFKRNEFNGFWTIRRRNFRNGFRSDIHLWTYI